MRFCFAYADQYDGTNHEAALKAARIMVMLWGQYRRFGLLSAAGVYHPKGDAPDADPGLDCE